MIGQPSRTGECKVCGAPFTRYNTIQALCPTHSAERQRKIREQARIGRSLMKQSVEMQGRAIEGTPLKPLRSKPRKPLSCRTCGKPYLPARPSLDASSKYCSIPCQREGRTKAETRKCRVCFKEFPFQPSQTKAYKNAGVACSRACSREYLVRKHANAAIKDKYGRTSRKADKEWQAAVRQRDGRICRRCGVYEEYIHTHHVALRSQRPDLKHDVDNGICLCGSCHAWVHQHPKLAKEGGFISDERYGVEQKAKRSANISAAKDQGRHRVVECTICGAKKTYYNSSLGNLSETKYRCFNCYQTHPIRRAA